MDLTPIRDKILLATLANVPFDGWTRRALADGIARAGYDADTGLLAFPDGPREVIAHFSDWADRQMLAAVDDAGEDFLALRVRDRIAFLVRRRLEAMAPHREAWRRAAIALALPGRTPAGRLLYRTVDSMWRAAGDTATDFNFYSKRGLLAGVLAATTVVWMNDRSAEHAATWAFLDRRIEDVLRAGRSLGRVKRLGPLAEAPFRAAARLRRVRPSVSPRPAA